MSSVGSATSAAAAPTAALRKVSAFSSRLMSVRSGVVLARLRVDCFYFVEPVAEQICLLRTLASSGVALREIPNDRLPPGVKVLVFG